MPDTPNTTTPTPDEPRGPLPRDYEGYEEFLAILTDKIESAENPQLMSALVINASLVAAAPTMGVHGLQNYLAQAHQNVPRFAEVIGAARLV